MRVIAGSARGRQITAPPGKTTRPTSDLVRGAVFDMLTAAGADFSAVLDLYAGSGALGIEALSRGEGRCDFVEQEQRACGTIRRNLRDLGLEDRGRVYRTTVEAALERLKGPYTLILVDPPYADTGAIAMLARWAEQADLPDGAMLVLEHSRRVDGPERMGPLARIRERRHGDTTVSVYARAGGAAEAVATAGDSEKGTA